MIDSLQLITHLPLGPFAMPANVYIFFQMVNQAMSLNFFLDVVDIEYWLSFEEQEPMNENYDLMGYESTNFISNCYVFIGVVTFYPFIVLLSFLFMRYCKRTLMTEHLIKVMQYEFPARTLMEGYLEICISCFIQFKFIGFSDYSSQLGSLAAIVFAIFAILFPVGALSILLLRR